MYLESSGKTEKVMEAAERRAKLANFDLFAARLPEDAGSRGGTAMLVRQDGPAEPTGRVETGLGGGCTSVNARIESHTLWLTSIYAPSMPALRKVFIKRLNTHRQNDPQSVPNTRAQTLQSGPQSAPKVIQKVIQKVSQK